jgi:hypothetical protein
MAMHRRSVITNAKFIYKRDGKQLRGKLRYFQYRDNKEEHLAQRDEYGDPVRRWVDRGLGTYHAEIAQNCEALATENLAHDVSARTLVISPQIDMMQAIPPERQEAIISELTGAIVEGWFDAMDVPTPDYSFVVHHGETADERPDGRAKDVDGNREFLHTHVILAATVPGLETERETYKVYSDQLRTLHDVGREAMERIWERELGREHVQELNQDLETMTQDLAELDHQHDLDAIRQALGMDAPDFVPPPLEDGRENLDVWFPRDTPDIDLELWE